MPDAKHNTIHHLQNTLVQFLKSERAIRSRAVESAFRHVPRHLFLPHTPLEQVYTDAVIPTKFDGEQAISSSSQPSMMAIMLEQADLKAGQRVLEIGAGTGYNAALIAHLIRKRFPKTAARLTTLDFDADIVADARANLDRAGYSDVQTVQADGWQGYPPHAPYDRIMLTVRAADIAPAWVDQLAADGRLILPLDLWAGAQYSFTFQRAHAAQLGGDILVSRAAYPCGFMPLRGQAAQLGDEMAFIGTDDGLTVNHFNAAHEQFSLAHYLRLLKHEARVYSSGVRMSGHEFYSGGFWLWLASRNASACYLYGQGDWLARVPPFANSSDTMHATAGIVTENGLALLARDPENRAEVTVLHYGETDQAAQQLIGALKAWQAQGSPSGDQLRVVAYPAQRDVNLQANAVLIRKPNFHYLLKWA